MQLVRHTENHEDFFLPNSLDLYDDLQVHSAGKENISTFSEIETVFPATEIQKDILNEDVQWAEIVLFSGNASSYGLETVFNAWTSLASHRTYFRLSIPSVTSQVHLASLTSDPSLFSYPL